MRLIGMNRAKPGDIIGQAVIGKDGCIMLRDGVILTDRYIHKLIELGVNYIYIEDDKLTDIAPEDPKFLEVKSEAVKSLSNVFSKLQYNDNSVDIQNTLSAITNIVEYLIDNKE